MSAITLNILKPSVNNLTVRIFVRAAGLDFEEVDVWGKTGEPEFLAKDPAHLTPMIEEAGLPKGSLWESCAIMQYLCNTHGLDAPLSRGCRSAGNGRQRDVLPHRHALSADRAGDLSGTLVPAVSGRGRFIRRRRRRRRLAAQQAAEAAIAEPLHVFHTFFMDGEPFIGGLTPCIADIRLAASLEFLRAVDYPFPVWAEEYMAAVESAFGDAYSEPVADVRGYIDYVRSQ